MMYYTYLHRRASDNQPFYIGKGVNRRAWSSKNRNPHWRHTVAKHGVQVEVLAKWTTEQEALDHEQFLIACFRDMGYKLVNQTDGGEGSSGRVVSDETKRKISDAVAPRLKSQAGREAASAAAKKRMQDREERERIAASLRAYYSDPVAKQKLREDGLRQASDPAMLAKMVASGRLVARAVQCVEAGLSFVSIVEAVKWLGSEGKTRAQVRPISEVARGLRKSAYGYTWKFIERNN